MRTHAEVLEGLAGVLRATEQQGVGAGRSTESKLVESQSLTTGLLNASLGAPGEPQSGDAELGHLEQTVVVGDGSDNNDSLALVDIGLVGRIGELRDARWKPGDGSSWT